MQMILRVKFTKEDYLKYISHLDLMRLFQRTFRRGYIPIRYSEGFNPQPKFSIANPLALGIESVEEYMDIDLYEKISIEDFIERMNRELPEGIRIVEAKYIEDNKSISALISWSYYQIKFIAKDINSKEELQNLLKNWLKKEEIIIKKVRRKGNKIRERDQNIRGFIGNIIIEDFRVEADLPFKTTIVMNCLLKAGDNGNLKPTDFLEVMEKHINIGIDFDTVDIKRLQLLAEDKGRIVSLM